MAATGNDDSAFSDWIYDRATVARNAGGSLVGWDPSAEGGWHRWKEDGIAAGAGLALNVGTFFIPVAGQVGAGLKAGSIGARVARIAGAGAELAVQGGSWAVRGGVKIVTGLRTAVTRFDLNGLMPGARAGQLVDAGAGIRLNPGGLVNAMTDASHAAPSGAAHVPVREALFGRDTAPDLDTGARTAPDGPHSRREGQSPPASGEAPAVRGPHHTNVVQDDVASHQTAAVPEVPHALEGDGVHVDGHPDFSGAPSEHSNGPRSEILPGMAEHSAIQPEPYPDIPPPVPIDRSLVDSSVFDAFKPAVERDGATFWSGRVIIEGDVVPDGAMNGARLLAERTYGATLEQLLERQGLAERMPTDWTDVRTTETWRAVSTELASNASGDVRLYLGDVRPASVWKQYEFPTFRNPNVTSISIIDAASGELLRVYRP
ncbi:hypothetical protein [Cellulomonas timonensis]|uniref:hypothetical protein n=1 Tax=Cellulomonas timonensis TaxID=1689271 RepID=UPI000A816D1B|nr:hypothetical protein [Cellulomonas timonensis]